MHSAQPGKKGSMGLRDEMLNAPKVDLSSPLIQMEMMGQLITGEENSVSYNEIIPNLHLGRAADTVNTGYELVVCATNGARELHASLRAPGLELVQLPLMVDGQDVSADAGSYLHADVGPESFTFDGQRPLRHALRRIDAVLRQGGRVLVCCQQGKDRAALVVLAYLRARFDVPGEHVDNLFNYVQQKRYIITTNEIPQYWDFLRHDFDMPLAQQMMHSAQPGKKGSMGLRDEMLNAPKVDLSSPLIQMEMMGQLITGEENSVSYNEIIPKLHLGRAADTVNTGYELVVCAANGARELHASLRAPGVELVQLPRIVDGQDVSADAGSHLGADVGPESFTSDGQRQLCRALSRIDAVLQRGGRVLVCSQQGNSARQADQQPRRQRRPPAGKRASRPADQQT